MRKSRFCFATNTDVINDYYFALIIHVNVQDESSLSVANGLAVVQVYVTGLHAVQFGNDWMKKF